MKTLSLGLIFLLLGSLAGLDAQNYFPIPTTNATWQVTRCNYFLPSGWYDDIQISATGEDTIINSKTYTKLFLVNHHAPGSTVDTVYPKVFLGGMRELNKKVYLVSEYLCVDTIERCLYDFNAGIGDTIYTQVASPSLLIFVPHVVYSMDSVLIGSAYHRRIHLADTNLVNFENWIEGVGSELGLVYASHSIITDNSYDLICFSENGVHEYLNPAPGFGFCKAPLPPVICDSLATGFTDPHHFRALLFPNPATNEITIQVDGALEITGYRLTDISGREFINRSLRITQPGLSIDLSSLPTGVYLLKLFSEGKENFIYRIIKS